MLSSFYPKTPVTQLHNLLDLYVSELLETEHPQFRCQRMLCVPVSAVVHRDARSRLRENPRTRKGVDRGQIALLITGPEDFRPLGALVIASGNERLDPSGSAVEVLQDCMIPTYLITKESYRTQARRLLADWVIPHPTLSAFRAPAANYTETLFYRQLNDFPSELKSLFRPVIQIGLSNVIGNIAPPSEFIFERTEFNVTSINEFDALMKSARGRLIREKLLADFLARSSLDLVMLLNNNYSKTFFAASKKDVGSPIPEHYWWPGIAVELDGPDHKKPEQQLRDHKKNVLCELAGIPLIRIDLVEWDRPKKWPRSNGVWTAEAVLAVQWDFLRYVLVECQCSLDESLKRRAQLERTFKFWQSYIEKRKAGLSNDEAMKLAVREDASAHEDDDVEEMVDAHVDEQLEEFRKKERDKLYRKRYGADPKLFVDIDSSGVLTGHLGNYSLPPLRPVCKVVGRSDLDPLRINFAEDWLRRRALSD